MEACLAYNSGYDDILEKLGFSLPGLAGRLPTIAGKNIASKGLSAGAATQAAPARQGLLGGMFDKAKSYLTTKPIPGRARGAYGPASQAEGLVPPNIRDDAGLAWAKTKEMFRKPAPKGLYEQIGYDAGGAHPAILRNQALSAKGGVLSGPLGSVPRPTAKEFEDKIRAAMAQQDKMRAAGTMPQIAPSKHNPVAAPQKPSSGLSGTKEPIVPSGVGTVAQTHQSMALPFRPTLLSEPPAQAVTHGSQTVVGPVMHNSQTAVRPTTQPLLPETKAASEVAMNYYEQGYADQMVQLGLYKDAGLKQVIQGAAGKARDLGSRALGKSKATVEARRANITSGRQSVTAAKDEKMLGAVRDKYKTKVDEIKGTPKPTGNQYVPPPEIQAILDRNKPGATAAAASAPPPITPPAGTEAEGPGNWEKFKGWWGERAPWQKATMGAGVALPVGAGLYMAGKDNPPSLAQQQMGYTPQY